MRTARPDANRSMFLQALGSEGLPSMPGLDAALRDGGKVADIGCGDGWSSIGMARACPTVTVDGYDVDDASIDAARDHCLPDGLSHPGSVGTGTVMRPATLQCYAGDAGFSDVETLPVRHDMFRFDSLVG